MGIGGCAWLVGRANIAGVAHVTPTPNSVPTRVAIGDPWEECKSAVRVFMLAYEHQ